MLFDPFSLRKTAAGPEEKVRRGVLILMVAKLGYPKSLLSVEKGIAGARRADILCYCPRAEGLYPLLLVECKAVQLGAEAERQAFGYNRSIKAPFIALASATEIKTLWKEGEKIASVPFLPSVLELKKYGTS